MREIRLENLVNAILIMLTKRERYANAAAKVHYILLSDSLHDQASPLAGLALAI